jgi:hypothetical protein
MVRLSETPDGPQLDREAHATVRPPALLDELAITVVQMEEALQLGSRRLSKEPPVCGYLLVGEESDRHALAGPPTRKRTTTRPPWLNSAHHLTALANSAMLSFTSFNRQQPAFARSFSASPGLAAAQQGISGDPRGRD